jgi:hypothetical protein
MATAFEKYAQYMQDSSACWDYVSSDNLHNVRVTRGRFLLLDGLGQTCDRERVEKLFAGKTVLVAADLLPVRFLSLIPSRQAFICTLRCWENPSDARWTLLPLGILHFVQK